MSETLLRQWTMLRAIPPEPRGITASELHRRLELDGFPVRRRTVERDLEMLSGLFPLCRDESERPYRWRWSREPMLDVPAMDHSTALSFLLAGQLLEPVLPRASLKTLEPYLDRALLVLNGVRGTRLADLPDKVRVLPRALKLAAPEEDPAILEAVYSGLLGERCIQCSYQARDGEPPQDYRLSPLGLVVRDGASYLIGAPQDCSGVRPLAVHRIRKATVLDIPACRPDGFDLDTYVCQGAFAQPCSAAPIRLEALFDPYAAYHLRETRLSEDQELHEQPDGRVLIRATVEDRGELRWWLLGFGDGVQVVSPQGLVGNGHPNGRS